MASATDRFRADWARIVLATAALNWAVIAPGQGTAPATVPDPLGLEQALAFASGHSRTRLSPEWYCKAAERWLRTEADWRNRKLEESRALFEQEVIADLGIP